MKSLISFHAERSLRFLAEANYDIVLGALSNEPNFIYKFITNLPSIEITDGIFYFFTKQTSIISTLDTTFFWNQ